MKSYFNLFKQTVSEFNSDKVPRLGAALAYYTIFSLAPLLLIAIAIAGLAFGKEAAQGQIFAQLRGVLGPLAAKAIEEMVKSAAKPKSGAFATIFGIVTLIFGASGVFGQLKEALNTIWDVPPKESAGILGVIKDRFLSVAMVLGIGFLLLVSLVIDSAIAALGKYVGIGIVLQNLVAIGVVTVLFAMIFRFLPDLRIPWRDVWLGAGLTSVLFVIGKFALGLYFGRSAVGSSYGAAGSLVLVLLWVYYSAQILLFGAEFTQVYARAHGTLKGAEAGPKPGPRAESDERDKRRPAFSPARTVVYVPKPAAASGGGAIKLAIGLIVGGIAGSISALVIVFKSFKKLFT
jgi:membrane protein